MTRLGNVPVGGTITAADTNAARQMINKTMQLMTPTSVSTGSIGTYGAVTVSAASSVSINGCFTPEFDWYEVVFDLATSAAATLGLTLRLSGTDATTAYDSQRLLTTNTTSTASQALNQANWRVNGTTVIGRNVGTVRLFGPALAASTMGTVVAGGAANPMTTSDGTKFDVTISHRTATAYDGITLAPASGNITGSIRVYGII